MIFGSTDLVYQWDIVVAIVLVDSRLLVEAYSHGVFKGVDCSGREDGIC